MNISILKKVTALRQSLTPVYIDGAAALTPAFSSSPASSTLETQHLSQLPFLLPFDSVLCHTFLHRLMQEYTKLG